jgi:catechol 2,3-dioxygenase-like lactoylglutathione lyase family enzyme
MEGGVARSSGDLTIVEDPMLTNGFNHIALITGDLDRLVRFYVDVFEAEVPAAWNVEEEGMRHAMLDIGNGAALHAFELPGNPHATAGTTIFARGHLDHLAINIADVDAFLELRRRLVEAGASDGMITDFGMVWSISFEDPDGLDAEIALWRDGAPIPFMERGQYAYPAIEAGALAAT